MKKKIVSLMMFVMVCFSFSTKASAQEMNQIRATEETTAIAARADVIERKYRNHNGVNQYRRWNKTQGYWVDPYWIDIK